MSRIYFNLNTKNLTLVKPLPTNIDLNNLKFYEVFDVLQLSLLQIVTNISNMFVFTIGISFLTFIEFCFIAVLPFILKNHAVIDTE